MARTQRHDGGARADVVERFHVALKPKGRALFRSLAEPLPPGRQI